MTTINFFNENVFVNKRMNKQQQSDSVGGALKKTDSALTIQKSLIQFHMPDGMTFAFTNHDEKDFKPHITSETK
jgi:hypothetical protein